MTPTSLDPATPGDLAWWLRLAPELEWIWARTYADSAPHWYVVLGRTPGLTRADFIRIGRVVRTFGEPGKFWAATNLYLFSADRSLKWWVGNDHALEATNLVNMANADQVYGPQRDFDEALLARLRLTRDNEAQGRLF